MTHDSIDAPMKAVMQDTVVQTRASEFVSCWTQIMYLGHV